MYLKNILIGGLFGLTVMSTTQGAPDQSSVPANVSDNIVLVSTWCERHPRRCHREWPAYSYPYHNYHPYYRGWAHHCWNHPYSSLRCERFCELNGCLR